MKSRLHQLKNRVIFRFLQPYYLCLPVHFRCLRHQGRRNEADLEADPDRVVPDQETVQDQEQPAPAVAVVVLAGAPAAEAGHMTAITPAAVITAIPPQPGRGTITTGQVQPKRGLRLKGNLSSVLWCFRRLINSV